MPAPGFEWFVAWRHLRDPERRSRKTLYVGLTLLGLGLLALLVAYLGPKHFDFLRATDVEFMSPRPTVFVDNVKTAGVILVALGAIVSLLGVLFASFTVFTAFSIFGVFLGTGAPIIALSVMSGFEADLKAKIRATKADIVITSADDRPFTEWQAVQKAVASVPGATASMAYIESEVIVKHQSNPAGMGIILRGIEPARATQVLDLGRTLLEGKVDYLLHPERVPPEDLGLGGRRDDGETAEEGGYREDQAAKPDKEGAAPSKAAAPQAQGALERERPAERDAGRGVPGDEGVGLRRLVPLPERADDQVLPAVLLGEELYARTLRVFMGSRVDIACPLCGIGPTGPMPRLKSFRVAGHFYTGMYEFDSKLAYVSLADAQRFFNMRGEVTGVEVRTADPEHARAVADVIAARIGPRYEVRSWEELNRGLFMALKLEKIAMFVVLTFIALVASFSIVSNLIMLVTQKGREVAILKSMGARDSAILRVFFAEGLYIGLLGLALGLVSGITGCLLISRYGLPLDPDVYYIQKLPVVMRAGEIASVALAALGLCCLATVYPAVAASRMRPVEGLRYE